MKKTRRRRRTPKRTRTLRRTPRRMNLRRTSLRRMMPNEHLRSILWQESKILLKKNIKYISSKV